MNIWDQGLAEHLVKFMKNPADLTSTQEMYRIFSKNAAFQAGAAKKLLANRDFVVLYESWYLPEKIAFDELLKLPENRFGHIYATHMITNKLDPNFIMEFEDKNLLSYLWLRAKHVHDIGHIITGFDTTLMGEISLKGFELAQYSSPSTAATTAVGLFSLVTLMPDQVEGIFAALFKGYQMGQRFPLMMAIKWDRVWGLTVSELKSKYGFPINEEPV